MKTLRKKIGFDFSVSGSNIIHTTPKESLLKNLRICATKVDYSLKVGDTNKQAEKLLAIKRVKALVQNEKNMLALILPNLDKIMTVI